MSKNLNAVSLQTLMLVLALVALEFSIQEIHTYRYNEDLFKKVTKLSDGKNHGLVFILDWSGSMSPVLEDTVKQMYNLIWFCRKVSIPFKVYAFTLEFNREECVDGNWKMPAQHYVRKEGLFHVDERFSLMEFFTSEVSSRELDEQMLNIWRVVNSMSRHSYDCNFCPPRLGLSGTPLNESIVFSPQNYSCIQEAT